VLRKKCYNVKEWKDCYILHFVSTECIQNLIYNSFWYFQRFSFSLFSFFFPFPLSSLVHHSHFPFIYHHLCLHFFCYLLYLNQKTHYPSLLLQFSIIKFFGALSGICLSSKAWESNTFCVECSSVKLLVYVCVVNEFPDKLIIYEKWFCFGSGSQSLCCQIKKIK
jgi:hypothetical protein